MNKSMRVRNMTEGKPLSHILWFAVPLFIGNIFQQVYSMVDQMVAGHTLGDNAIAAIGATSALYGLLIDLAAGMNSGYAITVTQSFGAGDNKRLRQSISGMMVLNLSATLLITALSLIFMRPLLRFMNTPDAIFNDALAYISVICGGMIATICYNMFAGILRAVGNSRTPLYFLMISCCINISMDILLIAVLDFGVAGAALATVIAQTISAILAGGYLLKNYREILPTKEDFLHIPREIIGDLLSMGFSMGLMYCVVDLGSVIFQRANNGLGEVMITAHTAARRWISIMMQPLATIATASSTFVGQNWGAKKKERIKSAIKQVLAMEIGYALFACLVMCLFGAGLVRFTTGSNDSQMISNAVMSIRLHFALYPALGVILILRTALQAMGRKTVPVISSCIELAMKFGAAIWLIPRLGFLGTSLTEPVTWAVMMAFLAVAYLALRRGLFREEM